MSDPVITGENFSVHIFCADLSKKTTIPTQEILLMWLVQ